MLPAENDIIRIPGQMSNREYYLISTQKPTPSIWQKLATSICERLLQFTFIHCSDTFCSVLFAYWSTFLTLSKSVLHRCYFSVYTSTLMPLFSYSCILLYIAIHLVEDCVHGEFTFTMQNHFFFYAIHMTCTLWLTILILLIWILPDFHPLLQAFEPIEIIRKFARQYSVYLGASGRKRRKCLHALLDQKISSDVVNLIGEYAVTEVRFRTNVFSVRTTRVIVPFLCSCLTFVIYVSGFLCLFAVIFTHVPATSSFSPPPLSGCMHYYYLKNNFQDYHSQNYETFSVDIERECAAVATMEASTLFPNFPIPTTRQFITYQEYKRSSMWIILMVLNPIGSWIVYRYYT